ncbi:MAG: HAD family hydrolase [Clostridiales bacterium GWF2_38_85]|nr:MAG: HAD family hydrolase [Clostridiales bacterium GWF2_38_85]HBL83797.1 HAD family hydrolase [Clostridiales bacterium]
MVSNSADTLAKLKDIRVFILDMDGTIYLGDKVLSGSREFISKIKKNRRKILYFTNNASKSKSIYLDKLKRLGYEVELSDIVTSGDVTIDFIKSNHPGQSVYLVGTPALEKSFIEAGINLTDGNQGDIVISSFDTTLTYDKLEKACTLIRNGALFYSTHPDFNCPTETGFIPDSGAICSLITASTGKTPRYFGKPHKESADMMARLCNFSFDEMAMVGDRLYTDIALGKNNGILSILVLTGETKEEDVTEENRGDIVLEGINDLINLV